MTETFKQAMHNASLDPPTEIIADGKLHRFTVSGDKSKSENGWYVLHPDDPAAGAFGCWKRGISETWSGKAYQGMTSSEKTTFTAKLEAMKRQRDEERERIQSECRKWCADFWNNAKDAASENSYLKNKCVNVYGLKCFKESLLVPVQDISGNIHGLQFIALDGSKRFKTGTSKTGHFFKIGQNNEKTVIICEGYATGASIHQATGHVVVIAFDAGNLLPVARVIHSEYPDMKIIIAADDDHGTEGNPGLTKAIEAAKVVNGLLAVPTFPDNRGPKDTDFNDMARLVNFKAVRACIEGATLPAEQSKDENPLDVAIRRLAALSPLQYDQVRKGEAKTLGIRATILDAAVKEARNGSDSENPLFPGVVPWSEPVNPPTLLTEIVATIRQFIVCIEEVSHAAALWVAMTWFIDVVQVAPLAVITAPEKRCGKTLLLSLFGRLSARAVTASNISPAALFRTIDTWNPTLLIDEADAFMKENEELRGLLNSGHTRDSAYTIRTVGENFTPTRFNTWGAKAISGIGHLADTLMDRAIILELRRKLSHEDVERIRYAEPDLFDDLRAKLARFAEDYDENVRLARPPLPRSLNDRAQDNWEPLLQIAFVAGPEWLEIATKAALKLSGGESASQTIGTELLFDIREIFTQKNTDRISTAELIKELCSDDEKRWSTYRKGKEITPRQLSNQLKGYGIQSKTIRIGYETPKGYDREQFEDIFSRYLPPENIRHTPQPAPVKDLTVADTENYPQRCGYENATENDLFIQGADDVADTHPHVADTETESATRKPLPVKDCGVVADKKPLPSEENLLSQETDLREGTI